MIENHARRLVADLRRDVHLGTDRSTGDDVFVSLQELKTTSMHIVGAAGYGKSYFLRNLIRQFVRHGQPFALIDPHRELCEFALSALRRSAIPADRVVLLDPSDDRHSIGFNPLYCGVTDPGDAASLVLESCLKAWGAASFDQTPRLEGILRGLFRLLIDNRLTLLEAPDILNIDNGEFRRVLRDRVGDEYVRQDWLEFEKLPRVEKLTVVESSRNRLRRFLQSHQVQSMVGQTENTLDLQRVMDERRYLLANIGGISAPETQRLLGALLTNAAFHSAKERNPRRRSSYFLIIDECGQFATKDLANSLDELRKFGVHLVLAHQRLRQLEREDGDILSAVQTNARVKIVFGGLERSEAERIARELFTGQVRGNRVKHITQQTKFRPRLDFVDVETESWSDSNGHSDSSGWSDSSGSDTSESTSDGDDGSSSRSHGHSDSHGHSESRTSSAQHSSISGGSRTRSPITLHEEFIEETSRQFVSIDEEWEGFTGAVHQLPKREALVRVFNGPVLHIRTPDVEDDHNEWASDRFRDRSLDQCPYATPAVDVQRQINQRRSRIRSLIDRETIPGAPNGRGTFRE